MNKKVISITPSLPYLIISYSASPSLAGKNILFLLNGGLAPINYLLWSVVKNAGDSNSVYVARNGNEGLITGNIEKVSLLDIFPLKRRGGFYYGTSRCPIENSEISQVNKTLDKMDAVIRIGGDGSYLDSVRFYTTFQKPTYIAIKTMDGDFRITNKNELEPPIGFSTATSYLIQTIQGLEADAQGSGMLHFAKVAGRESGWIALEIAQHANPTFTLIPEEISSKNWSADDIVTMLSRILIYRMAKGKSYGVFVIAEGSFLAIPDFQDMVSALGIIVKTKQKEWASLETPFAKKLFLYMSLQTSKNPKLSDLFALFPDDEILHLLSPDGMNRLPLAQISTHKVLSLLVEDRLKHMLSDPKRFFDIQPNMSVDMLSFYNSGIIMISLEEFNAVKTAVSKLKFRTQSYCYEARGHAPDKTDRVRMKKLGEFLTQLALSPLEQNGGTQQKSALVMLRQGEPVVFPLNVSFTKFISLELESFKKFEKERDSWAKIL